jgi:hypothetical protein
MIELGMTISAPSAMTTDPPLTGSPTSPNAALPLSESVQPAPKRIAHVSNV